MSNPARVGDILADLRPGEPSPTAVEPDPAPGAGDYSDACETCIQVTADRTYYTAVPHRVDRTRDGGWRAHYHHDCGNRWVTAWKD